jgi:hypothetical protein
LEKNAGGRRARKREVRGEKPLRRALAEEGQRPVYGIWILDAALPSASLLESRGLRALDEATSR